MTKRAEKLLDEALKLSAKERAHLGAELIASLDGPPDPDVEAAWAAEIDRRVRRIRAGGSKGEPWEKVHTRIKASLRRK